MDGNLHGRYNTMNTNIFYIKYQSRIQK